MPFPAGIKSTPSANPAKALPKSDIVVPTYTCDEPQALADVITPRSAPAIRITKLTTSRSTSPKSEMTRPPGRRSASAATGEPRWGSTTSSPRSRSCNASVGDASANPQVLAQ